MSRKKNSGYLSFPEQVRTAKNTARDIFGRTSAGEVGEWSKEDVGTDGVDSSSGVQVSVGNRERKQSQAVRGVKINRGGEEYLIHLL